MSRHDDANTGTTLSSSLPSPSSAPLSPSKPTVKSSAVVEGAPTEIFSPGSTAGDSFAAAFKKLKFEEVDDKRPSMFRALSNVFQDASRQDDGLDFGVGDWNASFTRADESTARGYMDVSALRLVKVILDRLWAEESSDSLANAASILADHSREPAWRVPFAEAGLLDFFLEVISQEQMEEPAAPHALRFIGNTCADVDANRQHAISPRFLPSIIKHLQIEPLANFAIPVLYNICIDYEPGQAAVRRFGLYPAIVDLLHSGNFNMQLLLSFVCRLLDISMEDYDTRDSADYALGAFFNAAAKTEVLDGCVSLVNAIVAHLQQERFQRLLVVENHTEAMLGLIVSSFWSQIPSGSSLSVFGTTPLTRSVEDEEQLSSMRSALIQALSDVSAVPEFALKYPVNSALIKSLISWLGASQTELQVCACIMLGNLARSDAVCQELVQRLSTHVNLKEILTSSAEVQVLHSALGFVRNLALPLENKSRIGDQDFLEVISRFWSRDYPPQLQYDAASVTRQLVNKSLANVQRILNSLSPDPESPAHDKTYLSLLLLLFERSDDIQTKFEVSRTVAAIWRTVNSGGPSLEPGNRTAILDRLHSMHPNVAKPLAMMVSQSQLPVLRSEGWFALALMARSEQGSSAVNDILQRVEVFRPLVETMTGQSMAVGTHGQSTQVENEPVMSDADARSAPQDSEVRERDRENVMVLISEVLSNKLTEVEQGDEMALIRRSVFEDLLRGSQSRMTVQELMHGAQS